MTGKWEIECGCERLLLVPLKALLVQSKTAHEQTSEKKSDLFRIASLGRIDWDPCLRRDPSVDMTWW